MSRPRRFAPLGRAVSAVRTFLSGSRSRLAALLAVAAGVAALGCVVLDAASTRRAPEAAPPPGDTVVLFGPQTFTTPNGQAQVFTEAFTVTVQPGRQHLLRVVNSAPDGTLRVTGGSVVLNGLEVLSSSELAGGGAGWLRVVPVQAADTLRVTVQGPAGAHLTVSLVSTADPTFTVFAERFTRQSGPPRTDVRTFTVSGAGTPHRLVLVNGNPNGTNRISSARIRLNGVEVVSPSDLSQNVAGFVRDVELRPDNTVEVRLTSTPGGFIDLSFTATDITPPVITIVAPEAGFVTRDSTVTVSGSVQDQTAVEVQINGTVATLGAGNSFSGVAPLVPGTNTIHVVATDAAGLVTDSSRTVFFDASAPLVTLTAPVEGLVTNADSVTVSGTAIDETAVTVVVNGVPFPVGGGGAFSGKVVLSSGPNLIVVTATDATAQQTVLVRHVTQDKDPPIVAVTAPAESTAVSTETIAVTGSVADATPVSLTVNGTAVTPTEQGAFATTVSLVAGPNLISVIATDAATNSTTVTRTVIRGSGDSTIVTLTEVLGIDSTLGAPALEATVATPPALATAFLYNGANPIQIGVAAGAIDTVRAGLVRGRVTDRAGQPIGGVRVTVVGHPELGYTETRANGLYDLAVNGGGEVVVHYAKAGFLPVQRHPQVGWQDLRPLDDVVLTPLSAVVTTIGFTQPAEVARGPVEADTSGARRATLLFEQGTQAELVMTNGSTQPVSAINVRLTEFTVGPTGPRAMPAELPPASAYTYAVELSADEALVAGATSVRFSQPVAFYVENFLGFPVGTIVPVGSYDATRGVWVAEPNGRVIRVVSTTGDTARLDVDGDSLADGPAALAALGISDAERARIALLYGAGQELWRSEVDHFTPVDFNFGPGTPPPGSRQPPAPPAATAANETGTQNPTCVGGSIIRCEDRVLGERIGVQGTPFALVYSSDRVPGGAGRQRLLEFAVSDDTVPPSLLAIEARLEIAGRVFTQQLPPLPNLRVTFTWDGRDAYGRVVEGGVEVRAITSYRYPRFYVLPQGDPRAFGVNCDAPSGNLGCVESGVPLRDDQTFTESFASRIELGGYRDVVQGLGEWGFSPHHSFDVTARMLNRGDGTRLPAIQVIRVGGRRLAGTGAIGSTGDGGPALSATFQGISAVAAAPDGAVFVADGLASVVRRIDRGGVINTVAGTGSPGAGTPGGPASQTALDRPSGLAVGSDGVLYIAEEGNHRVLGVHPNGTAFLVAGRGVAGFDGDEGPAAAAALSSPGGVAVGRNGSLFIVDRGNGRIREVTRDGVIRTFAGGGGASGCAADGGGARQACLDPVDAAVGPDGTVYIATPLSVMHVEAGGVLRTVAGNGSPDCAAFEGQVGLAALQVGVCPLRIAVRLDGSVVLTEVGGNALRRVTPEGFVQLLRTCTAFPGGGDEKLAAKPRLRWFAARGCSKQLSSAPDGSLVVASDTVVYRLDGALPVYQAAALRVAAEGGSETYEFTAQGRHLRTFDALTGATRLSFQHDAVGRLTSVTDGDGNVTAIERVVGTGLATAIVSPYGERTTLTYDAGDRLQTVTNPAGEVVTLGYSAVGLLATLDDPRGNRSTFTYDAMSRLVRDRNAAGGFTTLNGVRTTGPVTLTDSLGRRRVLTRSLADGDDELRTQQDAAGLVTTTTRRADGRTTTVTPDGTRVDRWAGDDPRFGAQAQYLDSTMVTLPSGINSTVRFGRVVQLADPDDPASLVSQSDSLIVGSGVFRTAFDAATRTLTSTSPEGRSSALQLDSLGRVTRVQAAGLAAIRYTYDARGRLASVTQGDRTATYGYNAGGRLDSVVDPLGRVTRFNYDAAGRVIAQQLPGGRTVGFAYDSAGNLTSLTPPGRPAHTFAYGPTNLPTTYQAPPVAGSSGTTRFDYSVQNELVTVTRPDSQLVTLAYDSAGRVTAVTTAEGLHGIGFDSATGQVTTLSAPGGVSEALRYDGPLPTGTTWTGPVAGSVDFTYGPAFRPLNILVNGQELNPFQFFDYDDDGLPIQVGVLTLAYRPDNGLLELVAGAGQVAFWAYDSLGQVETYAVLNQSTSDTTFRAAYAYDRLGRITQLRERVLADTVTLAFAYDSAGRLADVRRGGVLTASYEYDLNGNRTRRTTGAGTEIGVYDDQDRLLSYGTATYSYTANGELREKVEGSDTTRYRYDAFGNLREVFLPDGTHIEYVIDGQQRRIGRRVNGVLVQGWLYQGQLAIAAEVDGLGNVTKIFEYATRANVPDAMRVGATPYRLITDHLGSVRLVVNASTGQVVQRLDYDEYGRVTVNTNSGFQPFGYAGGLLDDQTQVARFGARDYDPSYGRWSTRDPIGFIAGQANLYAYAGDDPVNLVDPSGLEVKIQWIPTGLNTFHTFIRVTPENQSRFVGPLLVIVDPSGRLTFTISAGPSNYPVPTGSLQSRLNRSPEARRFDAPGRLLPLPENCESEDEFIDLLLRLDRNYRDNLPYTLFPEEDPGYNSNSYVAGLLAAAGLTGVRPPVPAPGWDTPAPRTAFQR